MGFDKRQYGKLHLRFRVLKHTGKTKVWGVYSSHEPRMRVGIIKWYWAWRRYVFFPEEDTHYDAKCLTRISEFIEGQMDRRKKQLIK